jgi:predicted nucleic acid-binding Zn ribbon protein
MRASNTQKLGEVIEDYLRALRLKNRVKEFELIRHWEELLGPVISSKITRIYIKERVLFVQIQSAVLRNELFMQQEKLLRTLNEKSGQKIIDRIVFR